jgi:hypothetical protein
MAVVGTPTLQTKAGSLPAAAFSGTPKVAAVAFGSPFSSANYSVLVDIETTGSRAFAHSIVNRTAASFIISLCADNVTGLVQVNWTATVEGEE